MGLPDALVAATGWLACPVCDGPLAVVGSALVCPQRHSFDVARQGYVNLLRRPSPPNADTAEMLAARDRFLAADHYRPIADAVAAVARGERLLEVGAGTGYYSSIVLDSLAEAHGLATDVSVAAARRSARAHPRLASVVADTWAGLPLADGAVDAVLCVFAPRNATEFHRVLAPGGRLLVVVPSGDHLRELRDRHGLLGVRNDKLDEVSTALGDRFRMRERDRLTRQLVLSGDEVADLIAMGPNAFHGLPERTEEATATLDVTVACFQRS